ncbi:hypothetical protein QE422_003435 [Chryseobacterium sp. SORGH_AS 447]|uniref:DUF6438 domain-containing protein n=1 Tax=Chryseobacterium sp. SORGH_AS_0447 TaxID=3041769 RepID=UPI002784A847|nr:DUF6438 domain-containing protein [Chryseobacterium sp. SORGH_AS_0447]MDQ1163067.1 hypothetical protein [Chryseobacterium sp. SORGH_AS_0447]
MDKKVFLLTIILISQLCFSQGRALSKIDSLRTDSEVESFVRNSKFDTSDRYSKFILKTIQSFTGTSTDITDRLKRAADSLGVTKSFYKGDFDHNGLTDLIFIGDDQSCQGVSSDTHETYSYDSSINLLLDFGKHYKLTSVNPTYFDFAVPVVLNIDGKDYLKVITEEIEEDLYSDRYATTHKLVSKILDYQFDGLVEYNSNPSHHYIQKIEFTTGMCYGTCPVFTLKLNKSGLSKFIAENYNFFKSNDPDFEKKSHKAFKKGEGNFETKIKEADLQNLENLLNYLNFAELQDNYAVHWTDDQSVILTITYDNGKTKSIKDYGLSGTYGLKRLYQILFDIRFNQDWKKVK